MENKIWKIKIREKLKKLNKNPCRVEISVNEMLNEECMKVINVKAL